MKHLFSVSTRPAGQGKQAYLAPRRVPRTPPDSFPPISGNAPAAFDRAIRWRRYSFAVPARNHRRSARPSGKSAGRRASAHGRGGPRPSPSLGRRSRTGMVRFALEKVAPNIDHHIERAGFNQLLPNLRFIAARSGRLQQDALVAQGIDPGTRQLLIVQDQEAIRLPQFECSMTFLESKPRARSPSFTARA